MNISNARIVYIPSVLQFLIIRFTSNEVQKSWPYAVYCPTLKYYKLNSVSACCQRNVRDIFSKIKFSSCSLMRIKYSICKHFFLTNANINSISIFHNEYICLRFFLQIRFLLLCFWMFFLFSVDRIFNFFCVDFFFLLTGNVYWARTAYLFFHLKFNSQLMNNS